MARNINIGLVIGGAIASSMGRAFDDVQSRIGRLEKAGQRARVLQRMIGETQELQRDYQRLAATGSSMADRVQRKLHSNLDALRDQGVAVGSLEAAYRKLGATARRAEFRARGAGNLQAARDGLGQTVAQGARVGATVAAPAYTAANFQATVRDIAIKAGIANTPQESQIARGIIANGQANGMGRGQMADLVNQLVSAGMDLKKAMSFAPVAAKFSVGQGVAGEDTGKLISAISRNAQITTPEGMARALSSIAYQGQAGNFEAEDMARWFPDLLAQMQKLGITGQDSVNQLGAMLQVQRNVAGTSDEAGNNLVNWISKIGSQETVQNYAKVGIDYEGSLKKNIHDHGMSALEASFGLAQAYIEKVDPSRAAAMAKGLAGIDKTLDPDKARDQVKALERQLRTGQLFNDLQVNAALTAYLQGRKLYAQLKADSAKAGDILDKNLAQRRQTSLQMWKEAGYAWDNALNSMGQAIEPLTDKVAGFAKTAAAAVDTVATKAPGVAEAVLGVAGGLVALKTAAVAFTAAKGLYQIGRSVAGKGWQPESRPAGMPAGTAGGIDRGGVMPVRVVNWPKQFGAPEGGETEVAAGGEGAANSVSRLGRAMDAARGALKLGGVMSLIGGAIDAGNVYATAKTTDEKASGYGAAAGGTLGATAGAAMGAALGSIVPIAGTAIGSIAGGLIGSYAGNTLGRAAGHHWAQSHDEGEAKPSASSGAQAKERQASAAADHGFKTEQQAVKPQIIDLGATVKPVAQPRPAVPMVVDISLPKEDSSIGRTQLSPAKEPKPSKPMIVNVSQPQGAPPKVLPQPQLRPMMEPNRTRTPDIGATIKASPPPIKVELTLHEPSTPGMADASDPAEQATPVARPPMDLGATVRPVPRTVPTPPTRVDLTLHPAPSPKLVHSFDPSGQTAPANRPPMDLGAVMDWLKQMVSKPDPAAVLSRGDRDQPRGPAKSETQPAPVIQAGPFSPTIQITMQQPPEDPRVWAEQVWPILQQMHGDYLGRLQRGQLFDSPMV